ncbi:hypothetical protein D3C81_2158460 [compost metagenome]
MEKKCAAQADIFVYMYSAAAFYPQHDHLQLGRSYAQAGDIEVHEFTGVAIFRQSGAGIPQNPAPAV